MAEFSQKRGKWHEDDMLGSAVNFLLANACLVLGVCRAAVLGIATLAVKQLIDRAASSQDEDDAQADTTNLEDSWKELSLLKATPRMPTAPALTCCSQSPHFLFQLTSPGLLCLTFQEKLLAFERGHVSIPVSHVALAKQLAGNIALQLQAYLRSKFPELPFGVLVPGGPLYDGLQVGAADEVRLLAPLVLELDLWSMVPGMDTVARDPRCWAVCRTQLEFCPRGSSPWDRFLVGGYLSSCVLLELFRKALATSINWPVIGSLLGCLIQSSMASEELLLEVQHECLELNVAVLLATTRSKAEDWLLVAWPLEGLAGNFWLQDLYPIEAARLRALDGCDIGACQRLLLLLCSICHDHPALRQLSRSHLTQVILRLGEEEVDWAEEALGDQFLQAVELLIGSLERASLPCHFNPSVNLLASLCQEINNLGYMLYRGLQAPEGLL